MLVVHKGNTTVNGFNHHRYYHHIFTPELNLCVRPCPCFKPFMTCSALFIIAIVFVSQLFTNMPTQSSIIRRNIRKLV